jgi:two-component system NtrC family sensor kinase
LRELSLHILDIVENGLTAGATLIEVTIEESLRENRLVITISDNGIGIKDEHLDLIFETFFTTKTDSVKGVGLGLSVCYGFIKDHGGDIKVESQIGEGTAFTISLPVCRDET